MKTDRSLSKVEAPAGQALRQTIRHPGQRAATPAPGARPAGSSEPFRGFSGPLDLVPFLCLSGPPLGPPNTEGGLGAISEIMTGAQKAKQIRLQNWEISQSFRKTRAMVPREG